MATCALAAAMVAEALGSTKPQPITTRCYVSQCSPDSHAACILPLTRLAGLVGGSLGRADADSAGADLSAARRRAVSAVDAPAGDELGTVASTDILGTGVVGSESQSGSGDYRRDCQSFVDHKRVQLGPPEQHLQARTVAMVKRILMVEMSGYLK